MNIENYPSQVLEEAVNEFSNLPGVGKKTALRFVLHLLRNEKKEILTFSDTIKRLAEEIHYCKECHNISDYDVCDICNNPKRDMSVVCVVENIKDVMAIESTHQFNGVYHVLGGIISPMDGVGPDDITVQPLIERIKNGSVKELIFALPTTMEGDTTNFYIYRQLKGIEVKITTLARGVGIGDELEYTDEVTLGRSLVNRLPFENTLSL